MSSGPQSKRQRTSTAAPDASADSTTRASAFATKTRVAEDGTVFGTQAREPPAGLYLQTVRPDFKPNTASTFANVTAEHVRGYVEQGFLVVEDAFSPAQVKEAIAAVEGYCNERESDFRTACADFVKRFSASEASKGRDGHVPPHTLCCYGFLYCCCQP